MNSSEHDQLQSILSHQFASSEYLEQALTHPSRQNEPGSGPGDYQRLEFLGDAILGMLLAELLFQRYPDAREGELSRLRSQLAGQVTLASLARERGLGAYILVGRGEELTSGRDKDSILCDVLEALIAAVYLDGGLEAARRLVNSLFERMLDSMHVVAGQGDFKSELQEWLSSHGYPPPEYRLTGETGPPHDRVFEFELLVDGQVFGQSSGRSKKAAQQSAAARALDRLRLRKDVL